MTTWHKKAWQSEKSEQGKRQVFTEEREGAYWGCAEGLMIWTEKSCALSDSGEKLVMKWRKAACIWKEKRFVNVMYRKSTSLSLDCKANLSGSLIQVWKSFPKGKNTIF